MRYILGYTIYYMSFSNIRRFLILSGFCKYIWSFLPDITRIWLHSITGYEYYFFSPQILWILFAQIFSHTMVGGSCCWSYEHTTMSYEEEHSVYSFSIFYCYIVNIVLSLKKPDFSHFSAISNSWYIGSTCCDDTNRFHHSLFLEIFANSST